MRTTAIAAAVLLLAFAGCGAADDAPGPSPLTESGAKRMAKSILLTSGDFDLRWDAVPRKKRDEKIECAVPDVQERFGFVALEESPVFSQWEDGARVQSDAGVLADDGAARGAMRYMRRAFGTPKVRRCLANALDSVDLPGVRYGKPMIHVVPFPQLAEDSFAVRVCAPMRVKGIRTRIFFDFVYLREGSAASSLFYARAFRPFPRREAIRLARLVEGRMELVARNAV